jgi:Tfp pilus assembly protein PilO
MSGNPATETKPSARREQIRVRVEKLRQSRQQSMLGIPEIVGLGASAVMLLAVLFAYFYFLTPARSRLTRLQNERDKLQQTLRDNQADVNLSTDKQATIEQINQSLQDFENTRLAERNEGRMVLYDELNTLMRRNNLRNTSGPTYTQLEPLGTNPQPTATNKPGVAKWQSVFPGIGVSVTVEGQYQNLRHFMRDVEASNQFIVINAVELQSVTDSSGPVSMSPDAASEGAPVPARRPTLVSLRLDLAAYFRRAASEEAPAPENETR